MDIKETEEYGQKEIAQNQFQSLLFSRIMPNLKKIGLLHDDLLPEYETWCSCFAEGDSDYELSCKELQT